MEMFYFGCGPDYIGHYWWMSDENRWMQHISHRHRVPPLFPDIDSGYCPEHQKQGIAALHLVGGWAVLAFWDRSADKRNGSHSTFVAEGEHTFDELLAAAREQFPEVFARIKFDIKQLTT